MAKAIAHISCKYFDEVVQQLQDTQPGFFLQQLAQNMDITTQQIRRIRKGEFVLDMRDLDVLKKSYQINPLYLLEGSLPMFGIGELAQVNEPRVAYGNANLAEENKLLRQALEDKNRIIELQEQQLNKKAKQKRS
jgi:hypothetical protein